MSEKLTFEFTGTSGVKYPFRVYKRADDVPSFTGILILSKQLSFAKKDINFQIPIVIKSTMDRAINIADINLDAYDCLDEVDHICIYETNDTDQRNIISSDLVAHYDEGGMLEINEMVSFDYPNIAAATSAKTNLCLVSASATLEEFMVVLPILA